MHIKAYKSTWMPIVRLIWLYCPKGVGKEREKRSFFVNRTVPYSNVQLCTGGSGDIIKLPEGMKDDQRRLRKRSLLFCWERRRKTCEWGDFCRKNCSYIVEGYGFFSGIFMGEDGEEMWKVSNKFQKGVNFGGDPSAALPSYRLLRMTFFRKRGKFRG